MTASAILSVMMGGALNGASALDASDVRPNGAEMPNDGAFAAMVDEVAVEDIAETNTDALVANPVQMAPQVPVAATAMNTVALSAGFEAEAAGSAENVGAEAFAPANEDAASKAPALTGTTGEVPRLSDTEIAAPVNEDASTTENVQEATIARDVVVPATLITDAAESTPLKDATATTLNTAPQNHNAARTSVRALDALLAKAAAPVAEDANEPQAEIPELPQAVREQAAREAVRASLPEQANIRAHLQANAAAQATGTPQPQPLQTLRRLAEAHNTAPRIDTEPVRADAESVEPTPTQGVAQTAAPAAKPVVAAEAAIPVMADLGADAATETQPLSTDRAPEGVDVALEHPQDSKLSLANLRTTAELAAHFITKMGQRVARFDMVLTPETLGTVDVTMEVGRDGQLQARMVFDTPAAANEMRARAEELRRQLAEAGFNVADNALEFTDRESQSRGGFNQFFSDDRPGRRAFAGANRIAEAADPISAPVWQSVTLTPRGVDMKV